jgi:hypothetical protein
MKKQSGQCARAAVLICLAAAAAAATAPPAAARDDPAQPPARLWESPRLDSSLGKTHSEPASEEPVPPAAIALMVAALLAAGVAVRPARSRAPVARSEPRWWETPPGPSRARAGVVAPPPPPPVPATPTVQGRPSAAPAPAPLTLVAAVAACVTAPALILLGAPSWARFPAVLLLLSLAPGVAILRLAQGRQARLDTGLVVCLSLASVVIGAQGAMLVGAWHPGLLTCLLAAGCLACIAAPRLYGVASRRAPAAPARDDRRPGPVLVGAPSMPEDDRHAGEPASLWRGTQSAASPRVRFNGPTART